MRNLRCREVDRIAQGITKPGPCQIGPDLMPLSLLCGLTTTEKAIQCSPTWGEATWLSLQELEAGSDVRHADMQPRISAHACVSCVNVHMGDACAVCSEPVSCWEKLKGRGQGTAALIRQGSSRKLVSGSGSQSPEQEGDRWAGLSGVTSRLPPAGAVHQHQRWPCLRPGPPAV